jgi:UDP-glucuronate 4-epimerase
MMSEHILVTGSAGFIGNHVAHRLLGEGHQVTGLDNFDPFYDPQLKHARMARLTGHKAFRFHELNLQDRAAMDRLFDQGRFSKVIHLAGQAGVRYSLENPYAFGESNLSGFLNLLEGVVKTGVGHLLYASSSSVYGANTKLPFSERDVTDHPVSLYAASKKANELMAHVYAHQHGLQATGMRFFTVYGPWGRPDMALYKFTRAIVEGQAIALHEGGRMSRDFTYIDDVVEAILRLAQLAPSRSATDASNRPDISHVAAHRVFNIGNDKPISVSTYLELIEAKLGKKARVNEVAMTSGEVMATWADITALKEATGFAPATPIAEGIGHFVDWYLDYHRAGSGR